MGGITCIYIDLTLIDVWCSQSNVKHLVPGSKYMRGQGAPARASKEVDGETIITRRRG